MSENPSDKVTDAEVDARLKDILKETGNQHLNEVQKKLHRNGKLGAEVKNAFSEVHNRGVKALIQKKCLPLSEGTITKGVSENVLPKYQAITIEEMMNMGEGKYKVISDQVLIGRIKNLYIERTHD